MDPTQSVVVFSFAVESRLDVASQPAARKGWLPPLERVGFPPLADVFQVLRAGVNFGSEALRWYRQWDPRAVGRPSRQSTDGSLGGGSEMVELMGIRLSSAFEAAAANSADKADAQAADGSEHGTAGVQKPVAHAAGTSSPAHDAKVESEQAVDGGHSYHLSGGVQVVAAGEDPRLVWHDGRFYVYLQQLVAGAKGESQVEIAVVDLTTSKRTVLIPPERTPSDLAPHGKNWSPFSWGGKLHFIYLFEPLRVLRCDDLENSPCHCLWLRPPNATTSQTQSDGATRAHGDDSVAAHDEFSTKSVGIFRGGSAGVPLPNDDGGGHVVGLGHVTFTEYR